MNKLFDEHEEEPIDNVPEKAVADTEEEEDFIQIFKNRDKIFNNDYNTGNLDFEEFDLPKVDTFYAEQTLSDCYDSYEYMRKKKLEEMVDAYFRESEFAESLATKKKIPKQVLPLVFVAIRKNFKEYEYTGSEIFTSIADYFGINYEVLYDNIPSIYREQLVRELDDKYGVLKKRGVKRLF
jgi:hypothetical protein